MTIATVKTIRLHPVFGFELLMKYWTFLDEIVNRFLHIQQAGLNILTIQSCDQSLK
jgi:hypothetical protein